MKNIETQAAVSTEADRVLTLKPMCEKYDLDEKTVATIAESCVEGFEHDCEEERRCRDLTAEAAEDERIEFLNHYIAQYSEETQLAICLIADLVSAGGEDAEKIRDLLHEYAEAYLDESKIEKLRVGPDTKLEMLKMLRLWRDSRDSEAPKKTQAKQLKEATVAKFLELMEGKSFRPRFQKEILEAALAEVPHDEEDEDQSQQEPGSHEVIKQWFAKQDYRTKLAIVIMATMELADSGTDDLAHEIVNEYESEVLKMLANPPKDISHDDMFMLGVACEQYACREN